MTGRGVYEDDETVARNHLEALLASTQHRQIPAVTDLPSLRSAIRYADSRPYARFIAVKGAAALGRIDLLPEDWPEVTEVPVHVNRVTARITASGGLVAAATGRPLLPPGKRRNLTDEERQALRERVHGMAGGGRR